MRLNQSGWVDPDGKQLVEKERHRLSGQPDDDRVHLRQGVELQGQGDHEAAGRLSTIDDRSYDVTAAHTGLSSLFDQITYGASSGALNFVFDGMFLFTTPYQV